MDDVDVVLGRLEDAVSQIRALSLDDPADVEREADLLDEMNELVRSLRDARLRKKDFRRLRRVLSQAQDREVAHARTTLDDDLRRLLGDSSPDA